jgi:hypothetical protein
MKLLILLTIIITAIPGAAALKLLYDSTFNYMGRIPEVVVTAPRHNMEYPDSTGTFPEVVVTAKRYTPEGIGISNLSFGNDRDNYQLLINSLIKYGMLVAAAVFVLTWSLIIYNKLHHEPIIRREKRKTPLLHNYLKK